MGYKDIKAGDKIAKPVAARFIKSKTDKTGFEVVFEFKEPSTGSLEKLTWVGWLTEAAIPYTMATLVNTLGFNGDDSANEDGTLANPQALAWDKEVKLVVEIQNYTSAEGQERSGAKIKWINPIGGSAYVAVESSSLKADLIALGFKAAFLAAKNGKPSIPKESVPF